MTDYKTDINSAYRDFSDTLTRYNDKTANFMRDCVYIANSRGENAVKGLRAQGFKLTHAYAMGGDDLHLTYENGDKAIDLYFLPTMNRVEVYTLGFNPDYKYTKSQEFFKTSDGADKFAEFIEGISNYIVSDTPKSESKFKCSMQKKKESLLNKSEAKKNSHRYTVKYYIKGYHSQEPVEAVLPSDDLEGIEYVAADYIKDHLDNFARGDIVICDNGVPFLKTRLTYYKKYSYSLGRWMGLDSRGNVCEIGSPNMSWQIIR